MAILGETQFLERIQFFNGQRLFADDLQTLEAFNREMRWLHNQSLHQAGVGSGYAVAGQIGDRQVTISPGYALDSLGREIILTEVLTESIPPVADNGSGGSVFYLLTVSYPDDSDLKPSETRAGICSQQGVVRLREEPVFCWVRLNDNDTNRQPVDENLKLRISKGLFIVLAQIEVFNCKLKQPVSSAPRRNAAPAQQPRIACGVEQQPLWKGSQPVGAGGVAIGTTRFTAQVHTGNAGFQATPCYVARIAGPRVFPPPVDIDGEIGNSVLVDALIDIATNPPPTPQNFTLEIFPFSTGSIDLPKIVLPAWQIQWLGIEN